MKSVFKWMIKGICLFLSVVILVAGGYVAYVFIAYHRLGDMALTPGGKAKNAAVKARYFVTSYNIGFGAYESDYGFFMDGGDQSRAWSKERLDQNMKKIADLLSAQNSDFYMIQEVDLDATRSYHIDERDYLTRIFPDDSFAFAQNYDSPYLFYPLTQPHGASKSGIMTFSNREIEKANRVELPIETGFTKFLDLDRCYSKSYTKADDGKYLILYNFHLSAYTSDGKIATEQLKLLLADIQKEYEAGNYCVAGGDFNKDILGDSSQYFGKADKEYTWAQPLPDGILDGYDITLTAPLNRDDPVPTCRNADSAYHEGQYVLTIDGFLTTNNIKVVSSRVIDTGFAFSDHNPVTMEFEFIQ